LVEQHLAADRADGLAEAAVLLLAVLQHVEVRAPHQSLDDNASLRGGAEKLGDGGTIGTHELVGIAAPVGEEQVIARLERLNLADEVVKVSRAVDERPNVVSGAPSG
jgi:hypothetical protein